MEQFLKFPFLRFIDEITLHWVYYFHYLSAISRKFITYVLVTLGFEIFQNTKKDRLCFMILF